MSVSPRSRWWEEGEEGEGVFLSPSGESQVSEEEGGCEVWIGSCEGHRAVLSVVGYSGQFVSLEVSTKV